MRSLYAALLDLDLFGRTFAGPTFEAWRTVAKGLDGLPMSAAELGLWEAISHRPLGPTRPFGEAYLIKPRRAGGTLFAPRLRR